MSGQWDLPLIMIGMAHLTIPMLREKLAIFKPMALLFGGFTLLSFLALPVLAQASKRDLTVELRQIAEDSAGLVVSTQAHRALLTPQKVRVRNGEKASLRVDKAMPMQWVRSIEAQSTSLAAPGMSASGRSGGVTHAVTWMDAGQSVTVKPRWPGGKQAVTVEIEVRTASVEGRTGVELPDQSRSEVVTTVSAPLGQWTTIASTGSSPQKGTYSSEATGEAARLLQIRVLVP